MGYRGATLVRSPVYRGAFSDTNRLWRTISWGDDYGALPSSATGNRLYSCVRPQLPGPFSFAASAGSHLIRLSEAGLDKAYYSHSQPLLSVNENLNGCDDSVKPEHVDRAILR